MATSTMEREFKFDADLDFDPPDLRAVVGRTLRLPVLQMRTTYWDTPDGRIRSAGASLRHRVVGEGDAGEWTFKLPSGPAREGALQRTEYTWPGRSGDMPEEATALLAGIVRRGTLGAVAELQTERRRLALQRRDAKRPWAEIDDDLAVVVSGPAEGNRFRQLELELLDGEAPPPGGVDAVLAELRRAGARPSVTSKLVLALGEAPAAKVTDRDGGIAAAVQKAIHSSLDRLLVHDLRLRLNDGSDAGPDPHDIHQARVATRTLRSDLQTFSAVLDPVWVSHVTGDLRWIAGVLGDVRDLDVLTDRVESHPDPADGDGKVELVRLLAAERRRAAATSAEAIRQKRYLDMLDRLHAAASAPPLLDHAGTAAARRPVERTAAKLVRSRLKAVEERIASLPATPDDTSLHRLRIAAKRLRYAAEAVEPLVGKPAARTAAAAKALQTLLGDAHDAAAAVERLRAVASRPGTPPAAAFVAGRIAAAAASDADDIRGDWRRTAKELRRRKNRSWM